MFCGHDGTSSGTCSVTVQPVALEADDLRRVVRQQAHGGQPEIDEDLRADTVVTQIRREAECLVRLDRVGALLLQLVGLELVGETDAAALVTDDVEDDAAALLLDATASPRRAARRSRSASEWNTSPVRHSEWTRTSTSSLPATSPTTSAMWVESSTRDV